MEDILSFLKAIDEATDRRRDEVAYRFWQMVDPLANFLEANGISKGWIPILLMYFVLFVYFLFDTSPRFTGKKLSLRERWKFFWRDFDMVKTMGVILIPFIFLFLFAFFGLIMIIPLILIIGLWIFHFFLSTEKYIDKSQRFSFKNFQIRWMMYWKGFDFFKGGLSILIPIGMIYVAIIHQIGIAKGFR